MTWTCKYGVLTLLACLCVVHCSAGNPDERPIRIKVLLKEFDLSSSQEFVIRSKKSFLLRAKRATRVKKFRVRSNQFHLVLKNKTLYGKGTKGPYKAIPYNQIALKASSKTIIVNNKPYHGTLLFQRDEANNKLFLINSLSLEDYVYAVLVAESYITWPHEMQKIQAVVSRTYAVHQMLERRKKKRRQKPYDITSNTFHQRYTGTHCHHHLRRAVAETKNLILTYNKRVALTMFDACCGGSVPAKMTGINFSKAPYLARKTPCHFCKEYVLYSWKRRIPAQKILSALACYPPLVSQFRPKDRLNSIAITNQDDAGIVHTIKLGLRNKKRSRAVTITGNNLWMSMSKTLRSQHFSLTKHQATVVVEGKGFGHQIGLCQRGARELVRKGWPLKKIVTFYYPETTLSTLRRASHVIV